MKKVLVILIFLFLYFNIDAQIIKDIFKFSTIYVSNGITSPKSAQDQFELNTIGTSNYAVLNDVTNEHKFDYNIALGIRKIARFDYDPKDDVFYDGWETTVNSTANVGALSGLEYNFRASFTRDEGETWSDQQYWLRYVGKYFIVKGAYEDNQLVDLKFTDLSARGKVTWGKFHLSAGVSYRTHPVYGLDPIDEWLENNNWWGELAYQNGFTDQYWYHDGNFNQIKDPEEYSNWRWFDPKGNHVAETDGEFYKYHFGHLVRQYNETVLDSLGMQGEISGVIGADYYTFSDKWWLHSWISVYGIHYGLSDLSFDYNSTPPNKEGDFTIPKQLDVDAGLVLGIKISKKFGVFVEGRYMRFWHIPNYQLKTGINYLIF